MPTYQPAPLESPELLQWPAVRETDVQWRGLLLGNGASIAVAESFAYPSLLALARGQSIDNPLQGPTSQLFDELATSNFEFVLNSLKLSSRVCQAVGIDASMFPQLYAGIQQALFEAVGGVHVPWETVVGRSLPRIRSELLEYKSVFSTNYDLVVYWAMMCEGDPNDFRDFFWDVTGVFDLANVEVWGAPTLMYFLHGGVHLRRMQGGGTRKQTAAEQNLLTQFRADWEGDETPLLVSEGTTADKLLSITQSDYLAFAFNSFARHRGNLVIFGHGLGDQDDHLVEAINRWDSPAWDPRQIAVSIRGQVGEQQVRQQKAWLAQRLPQADLWFFDADSHPLGQPNTRPQLFGQAIA